MPKFTTISTTHVAGQKKHAWEKFRDGGYIAIGWLPDADLSGKTAEEIATRIEAEGYENSREAIEAHSKFRSLEPGDYVAVTNASHGLFGIGVVDGPYEFRPRAHDVGAGDGTNNYSHFRRMKWLLTDYVNRAEVPKTNEKIWEPYGTVGKVVEDVPRYIKMLLGEEQAPASQLGSLYAAFRADPVHRFTNALRQWRAKELRRLLAKPDTISLETFNREVWTHETSVVWRGQRVNGLLAFYEAASTDDRIALEKALEAGEIEFHGNSIWGSGSRVYGAPLKGVTNSEKEANVRRALSCLVEPGLPPMEKYSAMLDVPGFGDNIVTGLVMVFHPEEFAIANEKSGGALRKLGYPADTLEARQRSAAELRQALGASDFIELDLFLYLVSAEKISVGPKPPPPPPPTPPPGSAREIEAIEQFVGSTRYVFPPRVLRRFHAAVHALKDKRFVALTGLSGTGKTLLTKVYAHAYHGIELEKPNPYYQLVPVRPNWNTPRDLLGYRNPILGTYEVTPFLAFMLRAASDPDRMYFAVLDEMNLAPVEYYLSDLLSAMESRQAVPLWTEGAGDSAAPSVVGPRPFADWREGSGIAKEVVRKDLVLWALGRLGGEARNDEIWSLIHDHAIHASSGTAKDSMRRVLQELRGSGQVAQGDAPGEWRLLAGVGSPKAIVPSSVRLPENLCLIGTVNVDETTHSFSDKVLDRAFTIEFWDVDWPEFQLKLATTLSETAGWALPILCEIHELLREHHLDFGYRTADEILRYLHFLSPEAEDRENLDEAIKMKILPKVKGDSRIEDMLGRLRSYLVETFGEDGSSATVVTRMLGEVGQMGSTRFWR